MTGERSKCQKCLSGVMHSLCLNDTEQPINSVAWNDDEPELARRVEELEIRLEEMWERMKQFERVMSTAFRLHAENELHRCT